MLVWIFPILLLWPVLRYLLSVFEGLLGRGELKRLVGILVAFLIAWHVYVPIHEFCHVGAALMFGGEVSQLTLKPQYGGSLLKLIFPFVVDDSNYAGQLSGFKTPNDLVYAWVDLAPYVLSLFGLYLVEQAKRRQASWLFPVGMLLALQPLLSIPGDFYELASLILDPIRLAFEPGTERHLLVSDDWFKLVGGLDEDASSSSVLWAGLGIALAGHLAALFLPLQLACARLLLKEPLPVSLCQVKACMGKSELKDSQE